MHIFLGSETERSAILRQFPHTAQVMGADGILAVAKEDQQIIGFAWAFIRDIHTSIPLKELFISVIDVFDPLRRGKGIGSLLVKKCMDAAREHQCYQVRAYCDIGNLPSNRLWIKNGFSISPVKLENGSIPGSYVTFKL